MNLEGLSNKIDAGTRTFLDHRAWVLSFGVCLSFLLHFPFFGLPPQSSHVWRQTNTLTVATNFVEEGMNILRPRVNLRENKDGVTGMQFPSYEWGLAWFFKVFGQGYWVHHLYSLLIVFIGAFAFSELLLMLTGSMTAASLGAWIFLWNPELFFWGFFALPDPLALACSLGGMVLFIRWIEGGRQPQFWGALFLVTLGGMTKIQHLMVGLPLAVLALRQGSPARVRTGWLAFFACFSIGLTLGWYAYAKWLTQTSGLHQFGLEVARWPGILEALGSFGHVLWRDFPKFLVGYPTLFMACWGAWEAYRSGFLRGNSRWFWLTWAFLAACWQLVEISKVLFHVYYLFPWIPVLSALAVRGGLELLTRRRTLWLLLLLLLCPVHAFYHMAMPRWVHHIDLAPEFAVATSLDRLRKAVPDGALCVVGPDKTDSIFLFFLHKKGFRFRNLGELETGRSSVNYKSNFSGTLARALQLGAKYLYVRDPRASKQPFIAPYLGKRILREGKFEVYELRPPKAKSK